MPEENRNRNTAGLKTNKNKWQQIVHSQLQLLNDQRASADLHFSFLRLVWSSTTNKGHSRGQRAEAVILMHVARPAWLVLPRSALKKNKNKKALKQLSPTNTAFWQASAA